MTFDLRDVGCPQEHLLCRLGLILGVTVSGVNSESGDGEKRVKKDWGCRRRFRRSNGWMKIGGLCGKLVREVWGMYVRRY